MTQEQANKRIAEILGWTEIHGGEADGGLYLRGIPPEWSAGVVRAVPNFFGSLDTMHEAIRGLTYEQAEQFDVELLEICRRENKERDNPFPLRFAVSNATASQRAEAFLRVFGQWKEEQE